MEFNAMREKMIRHFNELAQNADRLFEVEVDKDEMWNLYLDSFPAGTNEIYRTRREYDCSCCRQFFRNIGNAVVIDANNTIKTLWGFDSGSKVFQPVLDTLDKYLKSHVVTDIHVSKEKTVGVRQNHENTDGVVRTWDHYYLELPNKFVDRTGRSEGDIKGGFRDTKNVFKRSLEEITEDSLLTVLELIYSNTLYKGEEWKNVLEQFLKYKKEYDKLTDPVEKDNYAWVNSIKAGIAIGRIRNHSIGTLLINISEGMDLDTAVRKYEVIVAPINYKRPKEIFTQRMLDEAKKTITELGYMEALPRRFATLDDITVNNILFSNKDAAKRIQGVDDIFSEMSKDTVHHAKKFSKVEEITIDKFVSDILPLTNELEVYLENKHAGNMVSLIAPQNRDAKTMFKWNNNFGWAYAGNMTDSMKERVKAAGGKVDGDLRFSIQWNDEDYNPNDFDAHCTEPEGHEIYFGNKRSFSPSGGMLDVDIIDPYRNEPAVENIIYVNKDKMKDGEYRFFVHCYTYRGGKSGFKAEIEFDGQIYSFECKQSIPTGRSIPVATVTLKNGSFTIKEHLSSNISSREIWNLHTNEFVPVSVVCYSPNYWDTENGIGHRHVFFMLKDCINPEQPNSMFNEFLKEDLLKHKRVFAALGSKMHVADTDDQLSGIGFSTTKRDELIVKVKGSTERVMKIKF